MFTCFKVYYVHCLVSRREMRNILILDINDQSITCVHACVQGCVFELNFE